MFEDNEDIEDYFDEEQDRQAAIEKYESMLKSHDSVYFDSEEFEYIIDHYIQQNELKKSRQAVELAMSQHPESNILKIKNARQYLLENDARHAFELMQGLQHDDEPDYFLTLGSCLAMLGKSKEAIENYCNALPYFDEDEKFDLYNAIAFEYQNLKKYDLALDFYMKCLPFANGQSDETETLYHEIRCCYSNAGRNEEAIAFFQQLVDKNPHDSKAWANIGDCFRMKFQYENAIDPYEFALSIDPKDLWATMHLTDIYYDLGRFKEAIDTLEEALRNGVDTSIIRTSLGDCYYALNDLQTAEENYHKAVEINPMVGGGWAGMGYVCSDRGENKKAIRYFEKAYELEPWDTEYLYSIAADYRKLNDLNQSMEYLRRVLDQNPKDPDAYYYIADLYGAMDQIDNAINTLTIGLQQTENDPALLYLLAYAYFVKGARFQGLETLDRALEANFEAYSDFLDYDQDLLANDMDIIELIESHKKSFGLKPN